MSTDISRRGFLKSAALTGVTTVIPNEKTQMKASVPSASGADLGSFEVPRRPMGKDRSAVLDPRHGRLSPWYCGRTT